MKDKIKVIITDEQAKVKIPTGLRLLIRRSCTAVLVSEGFEGSAEISVTFVDDEKMNTVIDFSVQYPKISVTKEDKISEDIVEKVKKVLAKK